jgi:hypothetical protein
LLGGYVAGGLMSEDQAYGALAEALVGHTEDLERALKTVEDGLAYGQAQPITLEALEAERQAWLDRHFPHQHNNTQEVETLSAPGGTIGGNPWEGMSTLPSHPYSGYRGYRGYGQGVRHE